MIVGKTFYSSSSSAQLVFQVPQKRKKPNWYANLIIFYIVWITNVIKSSENKIAFPEFWMAFPYLQMPHFKVRFFDKVLKKELLKNGIIFAIFLHIEHMFYRLEIFFCYRNQKVRMHVWSKYYPEWKTALKFPDDTIITL